MSLIIKFMGLFVAIAFLEKKAEIRLILDLKH